MSKLKVGDKVYVEGVYQRDCKLGGKDVLFVKCGIPTFVGDAKMHKALQTTLCGNWVNYNGEKWWCVGRTSYGGYLIEEGSGSEKTFNEYLYGIRHVHIDEISLWQEPKEPKTITVTDENGVKWKMEMVEDE